ncbi:MAG: exodeoxyribonuclease VII small subunit [Alphaproteobacteria bacterium]
MAEPEIPKDIKAMSFEDALEELQRIVTELEAGKGKLDEAIDAYQRGAALKRHCESKLAEAKAKVDKIKLDADGAASTVPADEVSG